MAKRNIGRLWIEISGSSPGVPYFNRKTVSEIEMDLPDKYFKPKDETRMSIITEHGETEEPDFSDEHIIPDKG